MRKPLALMLAGLMAVSMVGCGSNGDAASSSDNKDKADSGKVTLKVTTTYAGEDTNAGNYKMPVLHGLKKQETRLKIVQQHLMKHLNQELLQTLKQVQNRMYYSSSTELIQTSSLNRVR